MSNLVIDSSSTIIDLSATFIDLSATDTDISFSSLIHPEIQIDHSFNNVLLIDSLVTEHQVFVDSANSSTFPIVYSQYTTKEELTAFLQTYFTNIDRIAICFLGSDIDSKCCFFLDSSPFFTLGDGVGAVATGENLDWMVSTIQGFHVQKVDYLACDTLQKTD